MAKSGPSITGLKKLPSQEQASSQLLGEPFVIVELETTGYAPSFNSIIQISIGILKKGKVKSIYKTLVNPLKNVPYSVTLLTGISNDELRDAPVFEEIAPEILKILDGNIIVSFNTQTTLTFLMVEFKRLDQRFAPENSLSLVELIKKFFPVSKNYSRKTSAGLLELTLPDEKKKQDTLKSTALIFSKIMDKLYAETKVRSYQQLLEFLHQQTKIKGEKKVSVVSRELENIPHHPGVYFFEGAYGKLLYIGKAKSLRNRLRSYLSQSAARKSRRLADTAKAIRIQLTNTELTALLKEAELIKKLNPKHNVMLRDYGNKYFLRLKTDTPYPLPELTNSFQFDGHDYYGLFISRRKAAEIKDLVDRAFLLRECTDKEFITGRGCFLAEIDRCLAPCYQPNEAKYKDELTKIEDFFAGKNSFVLERILKKMKTLSAELKFEQAAELKRVVDLILGQITKASLLSEPLNRAKVVLEVTGPNGNDLILLLNGKVYIHKYSDNPSEDFYSALSDFYSGDFPLNSIPDSEDLEKIRIILNWVIKNNSKVSIHYLKNFRSMQEIENKLAVDKNAVHPTILELPELLEQLKKF